MPILIDKSVNGIEIIPDQNCEFSNPKIKIINKIKID